MLNAPLISHARFRQFIAGHCTDRYGFWGSIDCHTASRSRRWRSRACKTGSPVGPDVQDRKDHRRSQEPGDELHGRRLLRRRRVSRSYGQGPVPDRFEFLYGSVRRRAASSGDVGCGSAWHFSGGSIGARGVPSKRLSPSPGTSVGRGPGAAQRNRRSCSAIVTSLMLASRLRITSASSNSPCHCRTSDAIARRRCAIRTETARDWLPSNAEIRSGGSQLLRPFAGEEGDDFAAPFEEFGAVAPAAVLGIGQRHPYRVAGITGVFRHAGLLGGGCSGEGGKGGRDMATSCGLRHPDCIAASPTSRSREFPSPRR